TVYATSEVANTVHVIDVATKAIKANISVGNRPRRFALTADGAQLWVSNELSGTLSIIDTKTNAVIGEIKFEPKGFRAEDITPVGILMTKDGSTAYVTMGSANHIAKVDVKSRAVKGYLLTGGRPWGIALSKDEKTLYVTNGQSDDMAVIDTDSFKVTKAVPAGRVPYTVGILE
ncbi:beta-propeller fold lactonase family protein, partial [Nevskia ramosa]|uniref:YVTN family beta-propeller repeat protein n=1 Tax=Nevskia ramosa TaxID=64002 RepID=UPI002354A1CC